MKNFKNEGFIKAVKSTATIDILKYLRSSLASSYGPNGRTKLIESHQQDDLKYGSSSTFLLNSPLIDFDNEIIKLIVSCAKEHLKFHYDHGLYCMLLSVTLIESGLNLDISPCLVSECFCLFLKSLSSHLKPHACTIVKEIDISKADCVLKLVNDILKSKPSLLLYSSQKDLGILLLKTFLNCIPDNQSDNRIIWPSLIFLSDTKYEESVVFDGFLLDLHHYTKDETDDLLGVASKKQNIFALFLNVSLTISDILDSVSAKSDITSQSAKESILKHLEKFATHLFVNGIRIVLNQRVVSNEIKSLFQKQSVIVIDRIGAEQMNKLKLIFKAKVVSSLNEDLGKCKVFVNTFAIETVGRKSFVHIQCPKTNFSTLVVCHTNSSTLHDLKHVCWATINMLDQTFKTRLTIEGGANFESHIISYLDLNLCYSKTIGDSISCSLAQYNSCLNCFKSCLSFLKSLSYASDKNDYVHDCYKSKVNAFLVAIETACVALQVKYQIKCD